ncbi:hypothetical protein BOFE_04590 [Candidatus Borrelia fainii]|uniref:DUF3996 domain-containing protein n=1 Tax=Candidatus Borrelia fainii TaxID=2518322 RepID=A0ABN6URC5_9SPIR|nr:DUF3996 domain-containing protein [Candidatus Borrelia fainii]BDU62919.1 hypothetical protein BOFE_04590 [Candidatus Borrelia fainii]
MKNNTQKIFILLLIFNLHHFAFSKSNNNYSIRCKQEDDGKTCITNDKTTLEKPKPILEEPKSHIITNFYAMKKEKNPYSFAAGIGTGNPLINLLISVPYVDIDIGYGSFLYFNPTNFKPYNLIAIDLIFKQQIGKYLIVGGGFGIGTDWSQANLTPPGTTQPSPYDRIGIVTRLPLSIEHKIVKNLSLGFKVYPTLGPTIFLTKPKIIFEGIRFKFFAIGFIKVLM